MEPERPLPSVYEAVLDAATLVRLVDDLEACATVDRVMEKGAPTAHATGCPGLRDAVERLVVGTIRGVQVWYRHDGEDWCDTLVQVTGGTRLVRMAVPSPCTGPAATS